MANKNLASRHFMKVTEALSSFVHLKKINVYLLLRERQRQNASRGGAEREGDTESEAGSRLRAVCTEPDAGLKPMT